MNGAVRHHVQTRWRDIDGLGHVNYAVAFSYMEEGRDRFLRHHGVARDEYVVGRCHATFTREIEPGWESVTVECALRDLRRSAITIAQAILDPEGEIAVEAEFGIVLWDPASRSSRPINTRERASLRTSLEGAAHP